MRRLVAIVVVLALALVAVIAVTGQARSDGGPYTVRAIFDNASFAAKGEDVRIAGANVGSIAALGVTADKRAAVTITITDSRFAPFYANAHCAIRPQSLIGEEYVDCTPGTSSAAPLHRITHGPGAGDDYLPVTRTSSPIDTDIIQDISTEPVRESLAVIINELGTGLATRGADLNAVIHRANPALGNTERVVRILARQDHTLARLATSSDRVLAPLARVRHQLAGFISGANTTAVASARQAAAIDRTFRLFPSFLRQLRPLMTDLGTLADQGTPVMNELGGSASALGRQFGELAPFAKAARTSLTQLGQAAQQAQPDLVASQPLARRLLALGRQATPSATSLATLLHSLDTTGGIEQLMTVLYHGVAAGNAFNSLGHYVRAEPLTGSCTNYAVHPVGGCSADFTNGHAASTRRPETASAPTTASTTASAASAATARVVAQALRSVTRDAPASGSVSGLLGYLMGQPK